MNEDKATRHQREQRRARSAEAAVGVAALAALALTPAGPSLARWAESIARGWPRPLESLASLVLFVAAAVAAWESALLASALLQSRSRGRAPRGALGPMLVTHAIAAAAVLPVAIWAALSIRFSMWLAPAAWWLVAGSFTAAGLIAALHVAPALLARGARATPIDRAALVERLGDLARRIRLDILSIDAVPAESAVTATALVAGAGASRRVFISSELLRDWSDEEIAVVVAHELGHHVHHDLWRALATDAALLSLGFWVAGLTGMARTDAAALPGVALVALVVFLAATPLRHALSRRQERRADAFALAMTGGPQEFRSAIRRLAARHLAEARPSRWTRWLYHRHPTVSERLALADEFEGRRSRPSSRSGVTRRVS